MLTGHLVGNNANLNCVKAVPVLVMKAYGRSRGTPPLLYNHKIRQAVANITNDDTLQKV